MSAKTELSPNGIYLLDSQLSTNQIFDAISACLCKAEALAVTAATTDFENYTPDIIGDYLWALSDIIREARWLSGKISVHKD